jgi:hypothetical protein
MNSYKVIARLVISVWILQIQSAGSARLNCISLEPER